MVRLFDAGMPEGGEPVVHARVWTVANGITAVRLLGLPLFVWLMVGPQAYGQAFAVLVIVGTTDWVDGYVARRFDQVTILGKTLDPLVDRALIATAGITLGVVGALPWWVVAAIVARDVVLVGAGLALFGSRPPIAVNRIGKAATACLLIGVPGFLLAVMDWAGAAVFGVVGWIFTAVGLVLYYAAAVDYGRQALRLRSAQDATAPHHTTTGVSE